MQSKNTEINTTSLPDELLFRVLSSSNLNPTDMNKITRVSKAFNRVADDNKLWQMKATQYCPNLFNSNAANKDINWKTQFRRHYLANDYLSPIINMVLRSDVPGLKKKQYNYEDFTTQYQNVFPADLAIAHGNQDLLNYLFELAMKEFSYGEFIYGRKTLPKDLSQRRILHLAILYRQPLATIDLIIKQGVDIDSTDADGHTALTYAVQYADPEVVELIIASGANVNKQALLSPLFLACQRGNLEIVKHLLDHGAQVNSSFSPLCTAIKYKHKSVINALIAANATINQIGVDGQSPLETAAIVGDSDTINLLFDKFADTDTGRQEFHPARLFSALLLAVKFRQLSSVKTLITREPRVIAKEYNDARQALFDAAFAGDESIVAELIRLGIDFTTYIDKNHLPLDVAVDQGHDKVVALLLQHGTDINTVQQLSGRNLLYLAAKRGSLKILNLLLRYQTNNPSALFQSHMALIVAAINGHLNIVHRLLDAGLEINLCQWPSRWTALHYAALKGHLEVVKALVARGAELDCKTIDGNTPLDCALATGYWKVADFLKESGAHAKDMRYPRQTALHVNVIKGQVEEVKKRLAEGHNIHAVDQHGNTALHYAVINNKQEVIDELLKHGANPLAHDSKQLTPLDHSIGHNDNDVLTKLIGYIDNIDTILADSWTPLTKAARLGYDGIVSTLLANGADVNAPTRDGAMALHAAVVADSTKSIEVLLAHGAKINDKENPQGYTCLHLAVLLNKPLLCAFLLSKGADVNAVEKYGQTPIQIAIRRSNLYIFSYLLRNKVNIEASDKLGFTPLISAVYHQNIGMVNTLITHGAKINVRTSEGFSALAYAIALGNETLVLLLLKHQADSTSDITANINQLRKLLHHCKISDEALNQLWKIKNPNEQRNVAMTLSYIEFAEVFGRKTIMTMLQNHTTTVHANDDHVLAVGFNKVR